MTGTPAAPGKTPDGEPDDLVALALHAEEAVVSKRVVTGATVQVATTTSMREQEIEEALLRETVDVERIPVGRVVTVAPEVRQEGDVTIVPVLEEVLVLERRLVLKEEIRIRRVRTTEVHRETVQLRSQEATVTRSDTGSAASPAIAPGIQTN